MINRILKLFLGDKHKREIKTIQPLVEQINLVYKQLEGLSDEQLKDKSQALMERIRAISDPGEQERVCDEALPEAFAIVRDACRRCMGQAITLCGQPATWDMVPYDVQLIGAVVLYRGKISEMGTGEGKTLVAVMPLYLNALKGKGVHLVTVNDYLASRDAEWMGTIYEFLGLTVGCIQHDMDPPQRKLAYDCDITYGTNNEFGFDYLRDNMAMRLEDRVQRKHHYAIIDEVDSVLIDEARTPLIISGPVQGSEGKFKEFKSMVEGLVRVQILEVNKIVGEGAELISKADGEENSKKASEFNYEAGRKLLQAQRGMPRNKCLMKLLQEQGVKKLIHRVEADYMRDKKLPELDEGLYFSMDERGNQVQFTEKGHDQLSPSDPNMFVIPDLATGISEIENDPALTPDRKQQDVQRLEQEFLEKSDKIHTIQQLLKAYNLFDKDVEYVVQDGKVMIVDEFTGRLMPGRRFSEGLHQALEAKEGVKIENETQTLATITLQNYFRLYDKLAGMTGTAETESDEFFEIYKLDVVVIPSNKTIVRDDREDRIYRTRREKFNAITEEIARLHKQERPVLVGTVSVEMSETLARMLKRAGISHHVLNAKYHQSEAEIITRAGQKGAVTIATNMAGRGTDIKLGEGVRDIEGLAIIGTERHEARRIDRQLRGRSGRQGDPGSSEFFLSLEDSLMRLFLSERVAGVMDRLGLEDGEVIAHPMVTRSIERAQKKVEGNNFQIRKHLLEYDDVMNQQREVIYDMRLFALEGKDMDEDFKVMLDEAVENKLNLYVVEGTAPEQWNLEGLSEDLLRSFLLNISFDQSNPEELRADDIREKIMKLVDQLFAIKCEELGEERRAFLMQHVMMRVIDENWREHLYMLDHLKSGINFRAYGQKDPLIEYKKEAFSDFVVLLEKIKEDVASLFFKARFIDEGEMERRNRAPQPMQMAVHHATVSAFSGSDEAGLALQQQPSRQQTVRHDAPKVGRNDPCSCGSGKKFKHCCVRNG